MKPLQVYLVVLTAAFVVLDATGRVDWPWWQVVSPVLAGLVVRGVAQFIRAAMDASAKTKAEKARAQL